MQPRGEPGPCDRVILRARARDAAARRRARARGARERGWVGGWGGVEEVTVDAPAQRHHHRPLMDSAVTGPRWGARGGGGRGGQAEGNYPAWVHGSASPRAERCRTGLVSPGSAVVPNTEVGSGGLTDTRVRGQRQGWGKE